MRSHPVGVALNKTPKYVASTTLTAPRWEDTSVLRGDLAAAIGQLKAKPGGELQVHGSGALIRWLLENDLVDEMTLITVPVILGQGAGLPAGRAPTVRNGLKSVADGTNFDNGEFNLSAGQSVTGSVSFELPPSVSATSIRPRRRDRQLGVPGRHERGSRGGTIEKRKPSRIVI